MIQFKIQIFKLTKTNCKLFFSCFFVYFWYFRYIRVHRAREFIQLSTKRRKTMLHTQIDQNIEHSVHDVTKTEEKTSSFNTKPARIHEWNGKIKNFINVWSALNTTICVCMWDVCCCNIYTCLLLRIASFLWHTIYTQEIDDEKKTEYWKKRFVKKK